MKSSRNVLKVSSPGFSQGAVAPCEPATPWIGGKRHLSKRICAILAANDHVAYVEPFVGAGGVFFRRQVRPRVEVINDLSGDVVTFMRVIQRFPDALFGELRWRPANRAEFDRLKETREQDLLDVERAARFVYLQTLAFGGKVDGRNFGTAAEQPHTFSLRRIRPRIERLHDRLQDVVIENLDWLDCIGRYDRSGTLFYLDPPYYLSEGDYGAGMFSRSDFARMAEKLQAIEGRFLLSINDVPEIRELFAWADMEAVETRYSVAGGEHSAPAAELLIGRGLDLSPAAAQGRLF